MASTAFPFHPVSRALRSTTSFADYNQYKLTYLFPSISLSLSLSLSLQGPSCLYLCAFTMWILRATTQMWILCATTQMCILRATTQMWILRATTHFFCSNKQTWTWSDQIKCAPDTIRSKFIECAETCGHSNLLSGTPTNSAPVPLQGPSSLIRRLDLWNHVNTMRTAAAAPAAAPAEASFSSCPWSIRHLQQLLAHAGVPFQVGLHLACAVRVCVLVRGQPVVILSSW